VKRENDSYNPELPPGFLEACDKYPLFEEDSIRDIWESLRTSKDYKEGLPRLRFAYSDNEELLQRLLPYQLAQTRELVVQFQARIWKAVVDDDRPYIRRLWQAMAMPNPPERIIDPVRAAIIAFHDALDGKPQTKQHSPTKKEVRRDAEEILKEAGQPLPNDRQWARIYRNAGLWALPKAPKTPRGINPKIRARNGKNGPNKKGLDQDNLTWSIPRMS
jgi:hypothetical protein